MSISDFIENYSNRTAGLHDWLNGAGNLTPQYADPTISAPIPVSPTQQLMAAKMAGFNTSDVNASDTQSSPLQDFANADPTTKAAMISQESMEPGSVSAPSQPFRDTTMGAILAGMMPNTVGKVFDQQRNQAVAGYAQHLPDNPEEAIQGMMKTDPSRANEYVPALQAYMANNNSPIARTAAEEAAMNLQLTKFKTRAAMKTMQDAQDVANGFGGAGGDQRTSQSPAELLGSPAFMNHSTAVAPVSPLSSFVDKYPEQTFQESRGNPDAVSPKGALGAKQIMPATGADPGYGVKPWDGTKEDNIRFGNDFYDAMLKNYKGNVPLALAAYNWGPHHVDKWIQGGGNVQDMPPETLDYIKKLAPAMQARAGGQDRPAQPLSPTQVYQQRVAQGVASGALPYEKLTEAFDPKNVGTGYIPASPNFGFDIHPRTAAQIKIDEENDKSAQAAANSNRPVIQNALRILDSLEPNFNKVKTGPGREMLGEIRAVSDNVIPNILERHIPVGKGNLADETSAQTTAMQNIQKGTNDLALELGKFQPSPGSRGGNKLQLQTILNSKPGMNYNQQTNQNIVASIRSKLTSAQISNDLDQTFRNTSPAGVTDENTRVLDDALKTIFPIEKVDKDGNTTFSQFNADQIRHVMKDAIANPQKYIKQAEAMNSGVVGYNPTRTANSAPVNPAAAATGPAAGGGKMLNFDAQGNLIP